MLLPSMDSKDDHITRLEEIVNDLMHEIEKVTAELEAETVEKKRLLDLIADYAR